MTYLIFIKQNSQKRFVKTEDSEIWNQNRKIYFKNTMELMWWNFCGSSTQIWTQTKKKNAPKDQNKTEFRLSTQTKNKKQINQKKSTTKICWQFLESHNLTKLIDSENKVTQTHHMNQLEIQARLKYPKIKKTTTNSLKNPTKNCK